MKRPMWQLGAYALLLLVGIAMALPSFLPDRLRDRLPPMLARNAVALGLDLQGGAQLLLAVDRGALGTAALEGIADEVRGILEGRGLAPESLRLESGALSLPQAPGLEEALRDLSRRDIAPAEPARFTIAPVEERLRLALSDARLDRLATQAADKSLEVIRHRIDQVGVTEPQVSRVGADRVLVQLPGVENPGQLRELLGSTARMDFHLVDDGARSAAPGLEMLPMRDGGTLVVSERVALAGEHLDSASAGFDQQTGRPVVTFRFDTQGARAFGQITAANIGRRFAVVLDGEVLTAPVIQEAITGGQGQISGNFTLEETQTLSVLLNSGALPASLEVIEERSVGASLGSDSIRSGLISGAVGLGLVVAMMVGLYAAWGLIASAILLLNVALTIALLGLLGATLTLPGIAGIILCLGIAVDANILIFSRIREETAKGTRAMTALARGYDKAWGTILDANVTTLLAMVILFWLGAGAIRGFAVTMTIGIIVSMFTAITLMRIIMEGWAGSRRLRRLEVPPLLGRVPRPGAWSFLRHGRAAIAASAILSTLAVAALLWPGPTWGIDFTGGVQMTVTAPGTIPLAEVRAALAGFGDASVQSIGGAGEVLLRLPGAAGQATVEAIEAAVLGVAPEASFARIDLVGPTVSGELAWTGAWALLAAVAGMLVYIWLRFEWGFAASAILVLALDVTKTFGVIALAGWEVNLPTIVALLTLIGYSVNDKVVVFDRIREALREPDGSDLREVVDRSLNQVLARCVFTSATTLVALVPMAIWGGPAVSGFAWPMIAGVIIATASSLFIAGPLLVWMHRPFAHAGAVL